MSEQRLRVLIAEDEPASLLRLRDMVRSDPTLELVAECGCGRSSVEAAVRERPALLFLDVQMPGLNGFEVVDALSDREPAVVFTTAYEQYAVRAFDIAAADYLLKPYDDTRFARSVDRARAYLAARSQGGAPSVRQLAPPRVANRSERIAIRDGDALRFLEIASITHVTAEDCYCRVHTTARSYLVRESLGRLTERLPSAWFRRIHRSTLINVIHVELVEPLSHGDLRVRIAGGGDCRVSRRYRAGVATLFARGRT